MNRLHALIMVWLNSFQRSPNGVHLNSSAKEWSPNHFQQLN